METTQETTTCPPKGASAEEILVQIEIGAATAKTLNEDAAVLEKAEKEAGDAVANYEKAWPKLREDKEALECFRSHEWQHIRDNPAARRDEVDAAVVNVDSEISEQETMVKNLQEGVDDAAKKLAEATTARDAAREDLATSIGYQGNKTGLLKAGREFASKAAKESKSHPATGYWLGTQSLAFADKVGTLKQPAILGTEVTNKVATLRTKADTARAARMVFDERTIRLKRPAKKLEELRAKRAENIASKVALLDP
jgi:hypothetical protein